MTLWPHLDAQVCTSSPISSASVRAQCSGSRRRRCDDPDPMSPLQLRGGGDRVSGTVLAQGTRRSRRQWEHALMLAKARTSDGPPLIGSELL